MVDLMQSLGVTNNLDKMAIIGGSGGRYWVYGVGGGGVFEVWSLLVLFFIRINFYELI